MNLLKKLFGNQESETTTKIDTTGFAKITKQVATTWEELFEQHGAFSFEKQLMFAELTGPNDWQFDMQSGTISFGPKLVFPVQVIGSLSFGDHSWMWGWANSQSGMPDNLLVQSSKMKLYGEENQIQELMEGHFSVEEGFEHKVGMIACGLFSSKGYYCANYGKGTLVVTMDSEKIPPINLDKIDKVLTTFPQFIKSMEVDHINAFKYYLTDRDFQIKMSGNKIEGLRDGKIIVAEFDNLGRLKKLKK